MAQNRTNVCTTHPCDVTFFLLVEPIRSNLMHIALRVFLTCTLLTHLVGCSREHEPISHYPIRFQDGRAPVMMNGKWGFIDRDGHLVIAAQYDWTGGFSEGLAQVQNGDDAGYIDTNGNLVIERSGGRFSGGLAEFYDATSQKFGYIDTEGRVRIQPKYQLARPFSEGLAAVAKDVNHWGYIDADDNIVVDFTLESAWPHSEGLGSCGVAGDCHYFDTTGKEVLRLPPTFTRNGPFQEGLARVSVGHKNGYVDLNGSVVISPDEKYSYYHWFSEGLAGVSEDGKWGFCDKTGRVVIPAKYPRDSRFL